MLNIVLLCAGGMSTSLLATRMQEAADAEGLSAKVAAYPLAQTETVCVDADIVLLGPQVRHNKDAIQAKCPAGKIVEVIDMAAYGMVDGKKVIAQVKKALGI